jgi:3-dehydroquinate synthase
VGVNHRLGKNLIGAFRQPVFVLIDPDVLLTLPERQIRSGIAEVVKYSLIHGSVFFKLLEDRITEITQLQNTELVESVLETCCQIKSEIVSQDELESGLICSTGKRSCTGCAALSTCLNGCVT